VLGTPFGTPVRLPNTFHVGQAATALLAQRAFSFSRQGGRYVRSEGTTAPAWHLGSCAARCRFPDKHGFSAIGADCSSLSPRDVERPLGWPPLSNQRQTPVAAGPTLPADEKENHPCRCRTGCLGCCGWHSRPLSNANCHQGAPDRAGTSGTPRVAKRASLANVRRRSARARRK
jgi:hypothetical protein